MQWIVPGLNSLREREVEAPRVLSECLGEGVGTQRKAGLSWPRRSEDLVGLSALHRGPSSPDDTEPSGGQLTCQGPGEVTHAQPRGSETD